MADCTDLIARLEKAAEGSRELDAAVAEEVHAGWILEKPDRYTQSLDAALTLVPEGCYLTLCTRHDSPPEAFVWWADDKESAHSYGSTLAVALVIAALKARQAGE
jgi:hypothetical protein